MTSYHAVALANSGIDIKECEITGFKSSLPLHDTKFKIASFSRS